MSPILIFNLSASPAASSTTASTGKLGPYFKQGFELHEHPEKVTIDMAEAHIWDQSGVTVLDQVIRKLTLGGSSVEVIGLNKESLDLFERLGGQEAAHI